LTPTQNTNPTKTPNPTPKNKFGIL